MSTWNKSISIEFIFGINQLKIPGIHWANFTDGYLRNPLKYVIEMSKMREIRIAFGFEIHCSQRCNNSIGISREFECELVPNAFNLRVRTALDNYILCVSIKSRKPLERSILTWYPLLYISFSLSWAGRFAITWILSIQIVSIIYKSAFLMRRSQIVVVISIQTCVDVFVSKYWFICVAKSIFN